MHGKHKMIQIRGTVLLLPLLLALAACGDNSAPDEGGSTGFLRSSLVLTGPPVAAVIGNINDVRYEGVVDETSGALSLEFKYLNPDSVSISGDVFQLGHVHEVAGAEYLLVGTLDASESFTMHRIHDATGDGIPDASTLTNLFDTGTTAMYITSVAVMADGTMYLLDKRCQDVLVATDTDSDGWADTVLSAPLARSADHEELLDSAWISAGLDDDDEIIVHVHTASVGSTVSPYAPIISIVDEDGDHVLDTFGAQPPSRKPIVIDGATPYDGLMSLTLHGLLHEADEGVEIWLLDAAGEEDVLLGSGSMPEAGTTSITLVQGAE